MDKKSMVALADLISQHPAQADAVDLAVVAEVVVADLEATEAVVEDSVAVVADLEATEAVVEDSEVVAVAAVVALVIAVVAVASTLLRKDLFKLMLEQRLLSELVCIDGPQV
jgi:hypothetical protein